MSTELVLTPDKEAGEIVRAVFTCVGVEYSMQYLLGNLPPSPDRPPIACKFRGGKMELTLEWNGFPPFQVG